MIRLDLPFKLICRQIVVLLHTNVSDMPEIAFLGRFNLNTTGINVLFFYAYENDVFYQILHVQ